MRRGSKRLLRQGGEQAIVGGLLGVAVVVVLTLAGPAETAGSRAEPSISASLIGTPGDNGWRRSAVTVSWNLIPSPGAYITNSRGCETKTYTDTKGMNLTCWAEDSLGTSSSSTVWNLKIDTAPPAVAASLDRQPDVNGWYTRQLTASFTGRDATSGIASCTSPLPYAGPDTASGQLTGTCRDRAGNQSSATVAVKYDATAPDVTGAVPNRRPDRYGWYNRPVEFGFAGADATSGIASCSTATYSGPNGEQASVAGTCLDNAGNASAPRTFGLRYSRPLVTPASGQNVSLPFVLDWVSVEGARFYNVQVWKGKRKVLSVWPSASSYRPKRSWRFGGERYSLRSGTRYRWYVWPRVNGRYGRILGGGVFDVVRRAGA
jgi:hypothetical protein